MQQSRNHVMLNSQLLIQLNRISAILWYNIRNLVNKYKLLTMSCGKSGDLC